MEFNLHKIVMLMGASGNNNYAIPLCTALDRIRAVISVLPES